MGKSDQVFSNVKNPHECLETTGVTNLRKMFASYINQVTHLNCKSALVSISQEL